MQTVAQKIDAIMSDAFDRAAELLENEARRLLRVRRRYSRFVLAVGWGPALFDKEGKIVKAGNLCKSGAAFMALADDFYDRFGADNRQVSI